MFIMYLKKRLKSISLWDHANYNKSDCSEEEVPSLDHNMRIEFHKQNLDHHQAK